MYGTPGEKGMRLNPRLDFIAHTHGLVFAPAEVRCSGTPATDPLLDFVTVSTRPEADPRCPRIIAGKQTLILPWRASGEPPETHACAP
jgi:hypothetical protein